MEPLQRAASHHDDEPNMTPPLHKHSTPNQAIIAMTLIEEADPPAAEGVEEADVKDLWINQESSFATFMVQSQTTQ